MKLYSWINNERGAAKTQGGNKQLTFTLDYEKSGHSWQCNEYSHKLVLYYRLDENNKPTITIRGNKNFIIEDKR